MSATYEVCNMILLLCSESFIEPLQSPFRDTTALSGVCSRGLALGSSSLVEA